MTKMFFWLTRSHWNRGSRFSCLNKTPLTGLCGEWGSTGSFHPIAAALVMTLKQWGLGLVWGRKLEILCVYTSSYLKFFSRC
jgi:hypothetical protein